MPKQILCTLGPTSLDSQTIRRLDELGVSLFRLNLSHTSVAQAEEYITLIRANSDIPICLDTQGAQVRTGTLAGGETTLGYGTLVELVSTPSRGDATRVPLYPPSVLPELTIDDLISIDFDTALLQVVEVGAVCRARVISSGIIGSNKAVSIMDHAINLPPLTELDHAAIDLGRRLAIPYYALSFANSRDDVEVLRGLVEDHVKIIAKVESRSALENLNGILDTADAILIDRGDLAREVPLETLPFIQKDVISRANQAQVPVYVATNLLESMVSSPRPTRAEVNDVINTLMDGADGLVLAAETTIGKHPVECVKMIRSLILQHETHATWKDSASNLSAASLLTPPHGGRLVQQVTSDYDDRALEQMPRHPVDEQTMMDSHQVAIGTFSPLEGFMGRETLESVLAENRLLDGTAWPMPILLQLGTGPPFPYGTGEAVALVNRDQIRAVLHVAECFTYDLKELAAKWFGTSDSEHPGVARLYEGSDRFVAGKVELLAESLTHDRPYDLTPAQVRSIFEHLQWQRVLGFHTRNVAHRAHEHIQFAALADQYCDGLFIHPVTGPKKTGDFSREIILKTYQLLIEQYYPANKAVLGSFASYSRYAGPREAVFTALCRKNFGCSHFIMGRDHTGVGRYYSPTASQQLLEEVGDIGIQPVFFSEVYYCQRCRAHVEHCEHGREFSEQISGTQARETLRRGEMLPDWHMRESLSRVILDELRSGGEVFVA